VRSLGTRKATSVGLPPGTLFFTGKKRMEHPKITYFNYGTDHHSEGEVDKLEEIPGARDEKTVTWINIDGLHDTELLGRIGEMFELHPLIVEDILQTDQRPKIDVFEDYIFIALKMLYLAQDGNVGEVVSEQVSIVLGKHYVISFQESIGDVFDPIRERIRKAKGKVRKMGADYLAYVLMDSVVDNYFGLLEAFGDDLEELEDKIVDRPTKSTVKEMNEIKRELAYIRKSTWPLREVVTAMLRDEGAIVSSETKIYLRDLYDHTVQVIETVETYRDTSSGMLDIYLSTLSNRMNEIMKVLTIIATIFIPLTFITGIYGMNFQHMPELAWRWGYPLTLFMMLFVAGMMIVYFRRKRWL
jgi:magnesium transporter